MGHPRGAPQQWERYNLSTALRQPVADSLGTFVPYGAMCLAGSSQPDGHRAGPGVNLLYQFWIHTDIIPKLGRFEEGFNTASHHRVHHGRNRRYIDRTTARSSSSGTAFGTFQREEEDEPVIYGLTKNIHTDNPVTIATHEYKDILRDVADSDNWTDRLFFVIRALGWSSTLGEPRWMPTRHRLTLSPPRKASPEPCPTPRVGPSTTPTPTSWRRRRGCATTPIPACGTASPPRPEQRQRAAPDR